MPLQPGQVLINRYRIVKLLGQGGFGAVYRAWDINLNKPCAVKENLDVSSKAQRQFGREATVLANLSHPNLPRVTDHFSVTGQGQYLVMDFVDGEDLATMMERQGSVPVDRALQWVSQVADALTYLHSRQPPVVHRDIKPANIRITPEGKAMLVDFGLVKMYDPNLRTTMGARAVTPGYAPPEQYGRGSTDPRSDIYALGATLYKLLTGQDPVESVQRMVGQQLDPVYRINPGIPVQISQVVERSMDLEPDRRFQSAIDFKRLLTVPTPGVSATMVVKPMPEAQVRPAVQAPAAPAERAVPVPRSKGGGSRMVLWLGIAACAILCVVSLLGLGGWLLSEQQASEAATAEARVNATLNERVHLTSTALAMGTVTAQAQATATAGELATVTARFVATEGARANYVSTLEAGSQLIFGPASGSIAHEADDDLIEGEDAEVDLRDFIVEARFYNPYSVSSGTWDYGFLLRDEGKSQEFRFVTRSNQTWTLLNNTGEPDGEVIAEGEIPDLDIGENGSNHIRLTFQGDRGMFFLNGVFIAEFDLSARMNSGTILIVTGIYTGDEITGEVTEYQDFSIWSNP